MSAYTKDMLTSKVNGIGGIGVNQTEKLTLQDEFGRMTLVETRKFWQTLDTPDAKRNFIWLAFTCLSQDSAIEILKITTLRDAKDAMAETMEAEQAAEWDKIQTERIALARQQTEMVGKVESMTRTTQEQYLMIEQQQYEIGNLRLQHDALDLEVYNLTEELAQYRKVIEGLKVLKGLLA